MKIIDRSITSKLKTNYYFLAVKCLECGKNHVAKYRLGNMPKKNEACPECNITGMLIDFWRSDTEAEAIEAAKRT